MKALADLSVVLDLLLDRQPWVIEASSQWEANYERRVELCVAAFAIPTLFYIVHRHTDLKKAHLAVRSVLDSLTVIEVNRQALEAACNLPGSDFEDNLQIACAVLAKVDGIVTRDQRGFSGSPIPIWTPAEALTRVPNS